MIAVETNVIATIQKVWMYWNESEHIKNWYNASPNWHAPYAENDLEINGKFTTTMAAKDGSFSFDFAGVYTNIVLHKLIDYTLNDGRKVNIIFSEDKNTTTIIETFEPETENTIELQKAGWQAILDNFKNYVENN